MTLAVIYHVVVYRHFAGRVAVGAGSHGEGCGSAEEESS